MGFPFESKQYSEFQVNIFSYNRDIRKCQSFCTTPPTRSQGYDNTSTFSSKTVEIKMSRQHPPAPTGSAIGPCPTIIQISRTPQHWKFTQLQHLRITRLPFIYEFQKEQDKIDCAREGLSFWYPVAMATSRCN